MDSSRIVTRRRSAHPRHPQTHSRIGAEVTAVQVANRLIGPLTEDEIESARAVLASGCRHQLLLGMRQRERLLTLLLPAQRHPEGRLKVLQRNAAQLRKLGADGFIHIRAVRLLRSNNAELGIAVHDLIEGNDRLMIGSLVPKSPMELSSVRDTVARQLFDALRSSSQR